MAQQGRFDYTVTDAAGNAISGASVTVYREGATVNGTQSGTSPLTVNVRHRGKIVAADSVFINTTTGTTYTVNSATATTVVLSGFVGTLNLSGGDRLTPSNSLPTLYGDDQAGATVANPLTTSATGRVNCWMEFGAYDFVVSGGGATTTAFTSQVMPTEAPGQIRFASSFPGADIGAQINAADADLGASYGEIWADVDGKTMTTAVVVSTGHTLRLLGGNMNFNVTGGGKGFTIKNHAKIKGAGVRVTYIGVLSTANVSAVFTNDDYVGGQQDAVLEGVFVDCWNNPTITQAPIYFNFIGEPSYIRDVYVLPGNGQVGIKLERGAGILSQDIVINGRNNTSPILGGILVTDDVNSFGHLFINVHCDNIGNNGYGIKFTGAGAQRNIHVVNFRNEQNGGALVDGIVLDDSVGSALIINPAQTYNSGAAGNLVRMLAGSERVTVINAHGFSGGSINAVRDDVNSITLTNHVPFYCQSTTNDWIRNPAIRFLQSDTATTGRIDLQDGGASFIGIRRVNSTHSLDFGSSGAGGFRFIKSDGSTILATIDNNGAFYPVSFIEGPEIVDPVAPATNFGRLYFRDNGAGKTQLVARFPTGAIQVIATEP